MLLNLSVLDEKLDIFGIIIIMFQLLTDSQKQFNNLAATIFNIYSHVSDTPKAPLINTFVYLSLAGAFKNCLIKSGCGSGGRAGPLVCMSTYPGASY